VYLLVASVSPAKMVEPIKMLFECRLVLGPTYHVLDGSAHWHYVANTMD